MSPVSRRRQTRRPNKQWPGTRLLPIGDATAEVDVVGACDLLISHLDGTLARRGITAEKYMALLMGMAALVGALASRFGAGPDDPAAFRELLTNIQADERLGEEFGASAPPT